MTDLLHRILTSPPEAYALLHRPDTAGPGRLEALTGSVSLPASLADVPLPDSAPGPGAAHEVLVLVPYRQITERGYATHDDGAPLVAVTVTEQQSLPLVEAMPLLPLVPCTLARARFEPDDEAYAELVRRIVEDEIGAGEGANFVIKRSFTADITDYEHAHALSVFRRLLESESGTYWTFLIRAGARTLIGASPERHVSVEGGRAVMNPISGTYRYPPTGPTLDGVMDFLRDTKERDELCMVVDEELKMMARICTGGGRVCGPRLKEMARLAHTEYFIWGQTTRDVRFILRETLFAPTVTGSPLQSAAQVIARHEKQGRGYYGGIAALIGHDSQGRRTMDSAILIRTADISAEGGLSIGVGSTLVRDSDPQAEVAETKAKAAGLIAALDTDRPQPLADHPLVLDALARRNSAISDFWLRPASAGPPPAAPPEPGLAGRSVLVVDLEDTFTWMIGHQLASLGLSVTVRRFDEQPCGSAFDLVVMGPGPGNPADRDDGRMAVLRNRIRGLLTERRPFVAVCLSHQMLGLELGFPLRRRPRPNQGVAREIDLFGRRERVGFYNTYALHSRQDTVRVPGSGTVGVCRDRATGEVHALHGPHFAAMQFHPESLLTKGGPRLLAQAVRQALAGQAHSPAQAA